MRWLLIRCLQSCIALFLLVLHVCLNPIVTNPTYILVCRRSNDLMHSASACPWSWNCERATMRDHEIKQKPLMLCTSVFAIWPNPKKMNCARQCFWIEMWVNNAGYVQSSCLPNKSIGNAKTDAYFCMWIRRILRHENISWFMFTLIKYAWCIMCIINAMSMIDLGYKVYRYLLMRHR